MVLVPQKHEKLGTAHALQESLLSRRAVYRGLPEIRSHGLPPHRADQQGRTVQQACLDSERVPCYTLPMRQAEPRRWLNPAAHSPFAALVHSNCWSPGLLGGSHLGCH